MEVDLYSLIGNLYTQLKLANMEIATLRAERDTAKEAVKEARPLKAVPPSKDAN